MNGAKHGNGHKFRDVVEFACHRGFVLLGDTRLQCQADGIWNGTVPACYG